MLICCRYALFIRLRFFRACLDCLELVRADIEAKKAGTRSRMVELSGEGSMAF